MGDESNITCRSDATNVKEVIAVALRAEVIVTRVFQSGQERVAGEVR